MLSRHGTRLDIGVADDIAELDAVEQEARRRSTNHAARHEFASSVDPNSVSPAAAMRDVTPKPSRRVPAGSRASTSTPPPPPML